MHVQILEMAFMLCPFADVLITAEHEGTLLLASQTACARSRASCDLTSHGPLIVPQGALIKWLLRRSSSALLKAARPWKKALYAA